MRLKIIVATALMCVAVLVTALPAAAQTGGDGGDSSRRFSVTGGLVVAKGESVDGPVVSVDGPARIDGRVNGAVWVGRGDLAVTGRVTGDALVLDGDVTISGRVDGDITVLNGRATVRPGADVRGDVTSRTDPRVARGTVRGNVKQLDLANVFTGFVVVLLALLWLAVTVSIAILGLLFVSLLPRATDAVVVAGRRVWVSFGWGLLVGILGPIFGIVVMSSIVGIPLGIAMLGTLAVLEPLGYVVTAVILGRLMVHGGGTGARVGAFFAGFAILRFAALVPGLGFVIGFLVTTYGLGALTVAGWRAAHRSLGAPGASEEMALGVEPPQPSVAAVPPAPMSSVPTVPPAAAAPASRPRKASARKTGPRKTAAKKRPTTAKTAGAKRSSGSRPSKTSAKKTGPRKTTAKQRSTRANTSGAKRSSGTRPSKASAKKTGPSKASVKKTGARKSTAKQAPARPKNGSTKRSSAVKSRATKTNGSKKAPARKAAKRRG